ECEPSDASLTCPCTGFAFGEGGDLDLVRLRQGVEHDRLHLTPFFAQVFPADGLQAIVQRWAPHEDDGKTAYSDDAFAEKVARRPNVQVIHFADYDHDGQANEFFLQTGTEPCGKRTGIVVGLSRRNRRLHALGTIHNPDKSLSMRKESWEALRDS